MEQQLNQERTRQETDSWETAHQTDRAPERERLGSVGQTARAVLAGASLWTLPPARLEELAGWMGNQGMNDLLAAQAPPLERVWLQLPGDGPETVPFPVPEGAPATTEPPSGL